MQGARAALAALSVAAAVVGCHAFAETAPAALDDGGVVPASGIALRGKARFPLQQGAAVVLEGPAETQPGDVILVAVGVLLATVPVKVTPPEGFTARGSQRVQGPRECSWLDVAYFSGRAQRSSAATHTFQVQAASDAEFSVVVTGVLAQYSGVDAAQPIDDETEAFANREVGGSDGSNFYNAPSLGTLTPNAELIFILSDNGGGTWGDPVTGPTRVTDTGVLAVFELRAPTAGRTEPTRFDIKNLKCGYTNGLVKVVALRPMR